MKKTSCAIAFALLGLGCGDALAPDGVCRSRDGIDACVDRSEYAPGQTISLLVVNNSGSTLLLDVCALRLVGRSSASTTFDDAYRPESRCGNEVTSQDILDHAIPLEPGGSATELVPVFPGTAQGFYRVNVWMLEPDGTPISSEPFVTPQFDVFPSAG